MNSLISGKSIELRKIHHSVGFDAADNSATPHLTRRNYISISVGDSLQTKSPKRKGGVFKSKWSVKSLADFQPKVSAVRESERTRPTAPSAPVKKNIRVLLEKAKYYDAGCLEHLNFRKKKLHALSLHFYDQHGGLTHDKASMR